VVLVSPSASGKAIVSLATRAEMQGDISDLKDMIQAWIPVASASVLGVKEDSVLESFSRAVIPIVSIHGDQDAMGRKVTAKLVQTAGAKGVELKGGHAVYLDSPHDFTQVIIRFLNGSNEQS
jgi:pimeloyl-ACP methyl ester carboxylesterase